MNPSRPRRVLTIRGEAVPQVGLLEPLQLEGEEGINQLFEYRLILNTREPDIDLGALIGRELTCGLELDSPEPAEREISGLITQARYLGEAERHSRVELTLRPWLHLATLTTDCKVFQDQSPVEIIEAVLADYPFAADKRLIERYPRRDYTVHYNESDFEFLSRLMQEWGINYHFEHSAGVHRLIWSDHNAAFQASACSRYHHIPYHPLGHKIDREYIHAFSPVQRLSSGRYASRDFDYTRPGALLEAQAEGPRQTGHAHQEIYLWRGDREAAHGQGLYQNETTTNTTPDSRFRMEIDKIQVNLFFDGTLNNYFNVKAEDKTVVDRHGGNGTSYDNALSNVARMWEPMHDDPEGPDLGVYVEGMGTTKLQSDHIVGKALGMGETGMRSRAQSAFEPLKAIVAKKRGKQGLPALLELNLFGFSRGAATARHFASLLRNQEEIAKHFPDRWSRVLVQVNFVGLFDTVSAEGLWYDNDADGLQLRFEDDAARRVFHLVALDEYRENFALTNIASACRAKSEVNGIRSRMGYELGIPGAHSDVGGGYKAGSDRPEPAEERNLPLQRSGGDRDGFTPLPGPQAFVYAQGWYSPADHQPAHGKPHRHVRQVQGDYHKVGLSLMVDMAEQHTTTQYPPDLKVGMQATTPEVAQVQQQLRAFVKDNAFMAWKPAQQNWTLEEHLGIEQARAFRHRFLHLSCSDAFAMQPRYRANTEQLERGHVLG